VAIKFISKLIKAKRIEEFHFYLFKESAWRSKICHRRYLHA
jgi:hypothetical protein